MPAAPEPAGATEEIKRRPSTARRQRSICGHSQLGQHEVLKGIDLQVENGR